MRPIMDSKSRWSRSTSKMRQFRLTTILSVFCFCASLAAQEIAPEMPMQARYEDGAEFRRLNNNVLDSRVRDGMKDLSTWSFTGAGEMTLTEVHDKDGRRA